MNSYIERKMEELVSQGFFMAIRDSTNEFKNSSECIAWVKSVLQEQQEMILEKVRKDLDNGKFEMICKNETAFAQYIISIIRDISQ